MYKPNLSIYIINVTYLLCSVEIMLCLLYFISENYWEEFTIYLFYHLKFLDQVYSKKGNHGLSLNLRTYLY